MKEIALFHVEDQEMHRYSVARVVNSLLKPWLAQHEINATLDTFSNAWDALIAITDDPTRYQVMMCDENIAATDVIVDNLRDGKPLTVEPKYSPMIYLTRLQQFFIATTGKEDPSIDISDPTKTIEQIRNKGPLCGTLLMKYTQWLISEHAPGQQGPVFISLSSNQYSSFSAQLQTLGAIELGKSLLHDEFCKTIVAPRIFGEDVAKAAQAHEFKFVRARAPIAVKLATQEGVATQTNSAAQAGPIAPAKHADMPPPC